MTDAARLTATIDVQSQQATARLKEFDAAMSASAKKAESATGTVAASTAKTGSAFSAVTTQAAGFAAGMIGVQTAAAAVTSVLSGTIGAAARFQQTLADTGAATGATATQMAAMRKEALAIGADTSKSASDAAAAMGELVRAGVSVGDTVGGVARTVVQMSEATGASVSEMANLLTNSLNTFGLAADQADTAANVLVKSANASSIGVGDMAQSLQAVGPVAKLAGLTIDDLGAAIGILGNNALKGQDAGTSLKTMLTALAAPTNKQAAEMERLGIALHDASGATLPFRDVLGQLQRALGGASEAQKAAALNTLFGSDAIRAGTIFLKEGVAGWDSFNKATAESASISEISAARLKTFSGQMEILRGTLETMGIQAGEKVLPLLAQGVSALNAALTSNAMGTFAAGAQTLLEAVGGLAKQFGALPDPIRNATIAAGAFYAAVLLIQANPLVAAFTATALAATYATGELRKAVDVTGNLAQSAAIGKEGIDALASQAMPLYVAQLKAMDEAHAGTAAKVEYLRSEHEKLGIALGQVDEKAKTASGEGLTQLQNQMVSNVAGQQALEQQAQKLGFSLESSATGGRTLAISLKDASDQTAAVAAAAAAGEAPLSGWAAALGLTRDEAEKLKDPLEKALQALRDLTSAPTQVQSNLAADLAEITSAQESLTLATKLGGDAKQFWLDKAREMVNQAGLEGDALKGANAAIDDYAKGQINGEQATKRLTDATKGSVDVKGQIIKTEQAYSEALGKSAEAQLGLGKSIDSLKGAVQEMVNGFLIALGKVPPGIDQMSSEALAKMAAIAGPAAISGENAGGAFALGILQKRAEAEKNAGLLGGAAQQALQGLDLSGEGAQAGTSFAMGLTASQVVATVRAAGAGLAAEARRSLRVELEQYSPSKVMIREGQYTGQGYAIGLENTASDAYESGRTVAESAADGLRVSLGDIPGVMTGAGQAVVAWGEDTSGALAGVASAVPPVVAQLASLEAESKRLTVEKTRLQLALANTEPYSAEAAAIEAQIKILDAWSNKTSLQTTLLKAQQDELEASRTALDGFAAAQSKALAASSMQARTGAGGLGAGQAATALLTDDTAKAGETLFAEVDKIVKTIREKGLVGGQALGQSLMDAAAAAASERSPEAVNAVLGMLQQINAQLPENARLGADTWGVAFSQQMAATLQQSTLGSTGAQLMAQLATAVQTGGQSAIDAAAGTAVKLQQSLQTLPEFMRGQLGTEVQQALAFVMAQPGDPAALDVLMKALGKANAALELFPRDLEKQAPVVRDAARRLFEGVDAGVLTIKEAQERLSAITSLIPSDFEDMSTASRAAVMQMASGIEDGADRSSAALRGLSKDLQRIADENKAAMDRMKADWDAADAFFKKFGFGASPGNMTAAQINAAISASGGSGGGGGYNGGVAIPPGYTLTTDSWSKMPSIVPSYAGAGANPAADASHPLPAPVVNNFIYLDGKQIAATVETRMGDSLQTQLDGMGVGR